MDLMEVNDDEKAGPGILSTKTLNTAVNVKYHDVLPTILDFGGTDNHTANSCMPFVSATGQGSVASELHRIVRIAAKASQFKDKSPSKKEESEVLKKGLKPEEWMLLCSMPELIVSANATLLAVLGRQD